MPASIASPGAAAPAVPKRVAERHVGLRQFPLGWSDAGWFVVAYAVLTGLFIGMGELVTHACFLKPLGGLAFTSVLSPFS